MHHIVVTTHTNSEHQRINDINAHAIHGHTPSPIVASIRSVANRLDALLQANRRSEPRATLLDQCE